MIRRWILIGTAVIGLILLSVWQHVHIVTLGYEIEQAQQERKELRQIHRQLLIEAETLSALDRIEQIAMTKLGMIKPKDGQVILVEKKRPSGPYPDPSPGPLSDVRLVRMEP